MNADFFTDIQEPIEKRREVYLLFGTFSRSMFTTFELTLGNWVPVSRTMIESVSEWYAPFTVCYKLVLGFAFVSVIRGVFLHETFKVASSDDDLMVVQKRRTIAKHRKQMARLFKQADRNGDGVVT